jgi:hypothetical protein
MGGRVQFREHLPVAAFVDLLAGAAGAGRLCLPPSNSNSLVAKDPAMATVICLCVPRWKESRERGSGHLYRLLPEGIQ